MGRLKGFLLFRLHNLLVARIAVMHKTKTLNGTNVKELGQELSKSLNDATRILIQDYGCPHQLIEIIATVPVSQVNEKSENAQSNGNHVQTTNGNHVQTNGIH